MTIHAILWRLWAPAPHTFLPAVVPASNPSPHLSCYSPCSPTAPATTHFLNTYGPILTPGTKGHAKVFEGLPLKKIEGWWRKQS